LAVIGDSRGSFGEKIARMPDRITVRLPHADPAVYLEWMAYWRDIERHMIERPALEAFAARESAPFLRDPIADWISDGMAGGVIRQAGAARRAGDHQVAPEITADALVLREAMRYIATRLEWLNGDGMHEAMEIELPSPDVVALREWALDSITVQLAIHFSPPERHLDPLPVRDAFEPTYIPDAVFAG
jgi:hypothetical protein